MYIELASEGFDIDNILLECPSNKLEYGELFNFSLSYKLKIEFSMVTNEIKRETKDVLLHVKRYGYCKI